MNPSQGKTALIIVDVQHDFLPGGSLGVPEGERILDRIEQLAGEADAVFASRDWHPENHCSFSPAPEYRDGSWPPHCVAGTHGAELHPRVAALKPRIINKATHPEVEAYSAFQGTGLTNYLVGSGKPGQPESRFTRLVVVGLATDYCVLATVLDALKTGLEVVVDLQGIAAVADGTAALAQMREAGAILSGGEA